MASLIRIAWALLFWAFTDPWELKHFDRRIVQEMGIEESQNYQTRYRPYFIKNNADRYRRIGLKIAYYKGPVSNV